MLDVLRDNAQSWIVKLLFAAIVIVFVFWGVGSFTSDREGILAMVNDQPILINDFIRAYETTAQSVREQNPDLTSADLREMRFKQQIFNQLLNSQLLLQKASDLGLSVSTAELQKQITSLPVFLSEDNRFDPQIYEGVLRSHRMTPAQFEKDFQHNLLMEKIENYVSLPARPNQEEVLEFFNYIRSTARVDYLKVAGADFKDQIEINDDQIEAYYNENLSRFMEPEKIRAAYLKLTPRALAPMQNVTMEEIERYYQTHLSEFTREERVSARHILIMVDEDAAQEDQTQALEKINRIRAELDQGTGFADLAEKYSDCPSAAQGGDLGSFRRGQMVPEFEQAAFALEPGQISEPVRTMFGWHLIMVEEHIPAGTRDLDEVRAQIRMRVGEEKAMDQLADIMDDILEIIFTGGDLADAAQRLNLETRTTGFFSRQDGPREIDLPETAVHRLFNMAVTEITETPIMVEDGYIFAQKLEAVDARVRDLEEVKPRIRETLARQKSMDMARENAHDYLKKFMAGEESDQATARLQTSSPFDRQGFIPDLGMVPGLARAAFAVSPGQWLDNTFQVTEGYVVARVAEHISPAPEEFEEEKDFWLEQYGRMQKEEMFQSFITMLRNQAKIRILRPEILEN
ncbi:SurA N-terminal domain-containing protein [Desulfonatronovibrio hydrogenovorans]|uniref:SurA N-terminal domain-containing protein n=1 Tax=Desulfonatronovibrio hydrogenovorans TaxID=53245 RepID=UPI00048FAB8F|nr:SurA N-terminal domain-containing protein [Desulfonatronovibrio hydrogenovorans]